MQAGYRKVLYTQTNKFKTQNGKGKKNIYKLQFNFPL